MNSLAKLVLLLVVVVQFLMESDMTIEKLIVLLAVVAVTVYQERHNPSLHVVIAVFLLICAGIYLDAAFAVLLAGSVFDFIYKKAYLGVIPVVLVCAYALAESVNLLWVSALLGLCALLAFEIRRRSDQTEQSTLTLDNERRLRYELEQTKAKLLQSSLDLVNLAEVRERNRIAREIHDSVGHRLAGIFIQLQAARKLHAKDEARSAAMLETSVAALAESLETLRETVHNLKPKERLGVEYIADIIERFQFCEISFQHSGDFNTIPASHLEIIGSNVKEALTNASKYSKATKVDVAVETNDRFTRLFIKDNGIGAERIKEGLGLSGMRERIRNIGGTISISPKDGFLIVCVMPRQEGGSLFEAVDR